MIVQARVLIMLKADAMLCSGGARQQRRRRAAVQVVNNIVTSGAQFPRHTRPRRIAVARNRDDSID